jgi:hypothetical protein
MCFCLTCSVSRLKKKWALFVQLLVKTLMALQKINNDKSSDYFIKIS